MMAAKKKAVPCKHKSRISCFLNGQFDRKDGYPIVCPFCLAEKSKAENYGDDDVFVIYQCGSKFHSQTDMVFKSARCIKNAKVRIGDKLKAVCQRKCPCCQSDFLSSDGTYYEYECGTQEYRDDVAESDECRSRQKRRHSDRPSPSSPREAVVHPTHYNAGKIEVWDAILDWGLGFLDGNVVKYIARARHKGGIEDLKKAKFYIEKLIAEQEAKQG